MWNPENSGGHPAQAFFDTTSNVGEFLGVLPVGHVVSANSVELELCLSGHVREQNHRLYKPYEYSRRRLRPGLEKGTCYVSGLDVREAILILGESKIPAETRLKCVLCISAIRPGQLACIVCSLPCPLLDEASFLLPEKGPR